LRSEVGGRLDPVVRSVISKLQNVTGVIACRLLQKEQLRELIEIETASNRGVGFPGLEIINEGIAEVSQREYVVAIAHSSQLRHPPGPIVVICRGDRIVGEEVWEQQPPRPAADELDAVVLGRSLRLYRTYLDHSKESPLKVVYRALRFPELETIDAVRDIASVTVNAQTHLSLSKALSWNAKDPAIGTVLIGFNKSNR
jgi:hypothetical protein